MSLVANGLAVGSVILAGEAIVAEGRNRAYDAATATDPLERTPIAHAEMNALARLGTDVDNGDLTLWTTQQPCPMCRAAIDFVGIPRVLAIATDPSAPADRATEVLGDEWVVLATAMFLTGPLRRAGVSHPTVEANRLREPESVELATEAAAGAHPLTDGRPLVDALTWSWPQLAAAASRRRARLG